MWAHFDAGDCPGAAVGVRTMLDNQVNGFIALRYLSDSQVANPEDRVKVGQTIYARIVKIDIDRFSVELTCRTSDLKDEGNKWKPAKDEYYDLDAELNDKYKLDEKKKRDEHKQTYTKRVIAHPQFRNIGYQQCVALLNDMDIGDAIIRPSSKGIDHLTLTWKVNKDVNQHIDIVEEKKLNPFSIGKRLIIDGEDFEDLDEILARHVNPMANNVREILNYKYFRDFGNDDDESKRIETIDNLLLNEQRANPTRIPYFFTCDKVHPGKFLLSYMVRLKAKHEYVSITPDGFKLRHQVHKSFNALVNWFKKHYNDPITFANPTPIQRTTTVVPGSPFVIPTSVHGGPTAAAYNTPQILSAKHTPSHTPALATTPQHRPSAYNQPLSHTLPQTMSSLSIEPSSSTAPYVEDWNEDETPTTAVNNYGGHTTPDKTASISNYEQNNSSYMRDNGRYNNRRTDMEGANKGYSSNKQLDRPYGNGTGGFRGRGIGDWRGNSGRGDRRGNGRGDWRGGRGDWRGGRGDWRGGRGDSRGGRGFKNSHNDDGGYNNANTRSVVPSAVNTEENWDDEPTTVASKTSNAPQNSSSFGSGSNRTEPSYGSQQAKGYQRTTTKTYAAPSTEENWDDEPVVVPSFQPSLSHNQQPQTTSNQTQPKPPLQKTTTIDDENWDDEVPVVAPTRPYQTTPNKPSHPVRVDDDWEEPPVRPVAPAESNRQTTSNWNAPERPPEHRNTSWNDSNTTSAQQQPSRYVSKAPPPKPNVPVVDEEMWD